jgi:hypothetical protein
LSGMVSGIKGRMEAGKRSLICVGLGFVLADAVSALMMRSGAFSRSREFALGLIFGVNLGALLFWRASVAMKRKLREPIPPRVSRARDSCRA